MNRVIFFVPGIPVPKGSAKAYVNRKTMRAVVMQDNREKQRPWASAIAYEAMQVVGDYPIIGPVRLSCTFTMPRLKGHYGTGKNSAQIKSSAPRWHIFKPDLDKLLRCVKDALTGVVWKDDSQVCDFGKLSKEYGDLPGVLITIEELQ